jgi:four helix bundle protein
VVFTGVGGVTASKGRCAQVVQIVQAVQIVQRAETRIERFERLELIELSVKGGVVMVVKYFEDLEVWKEARSLTRQIYRSTKDPRFSKDFGLINQIQRAVVSIMSNIAEGFERGGNQEFLQFLYIAKGSCGEVRSQLYVALDQGYVAQKEADELIKSCRRLSVMISNLIDYLRHSGMKGEKFKKSQQKTSKEEADRLLDGSTP